MLQIQSFTFNPLEENTYVLFNEFNQCAIIDPGCYFDEEKEKLKAFIQHKKLVPSLLLNTHCHLDHVFGNRYIAGTYGLTLQLHEKEKYVLSFAPTSGLMYNLPFDNYEGGFIELKEKDIIQIGQDELEVIEAPGHSPGSICFYCRKQNFLIGGDVLFYHSIGRTDLPGGNHQQLIENINNKIMVLPAKTIVYSGHGQPTTVEEEKTGNPFL